MAFAYQTKSWSIQGENPEGTWLTHEEVLAILEAPDWIADIEELNQIGSLG